jgi:hypothetical protein
MSTQVATSERLRPALDATMDARLHNLDQDALLFDPSPQRDSAVEIAAAMLRPGADIPALIAEQLTVLRQIAVSNHAEAGCELAATGVLDEVVASLHHHGQRTGLTVKAAAELLRPHLAIVEPAVRGERVDTCAYFAACCAIKDIIVQLSDPVLRGSGLRGELGRGRHQVLLALLPNASAEAAA